VFYVRLMRALCVYCVYAPFLLQGIFLTQGSNPDALTSEPFLNSF